MGILETISDILSAPQQALFQGSSRGSRRFGSGMTELTQAGLPEYLAAPMAGAMSLPEFLRGMAGGITGTGERVSGTDLAGGNKYLGTFLDFAADPAALMGTPVTQPLSRMSKLAATRRAITKAVPEYGEVLKQLPGIRKGVSGVARDLWGRMASRIPQAQPALAAGAVEAGVTKTPYRSVLNRVLGKHAIDIPYIPRSLNEPLVLKAPTKDVSMITEPLNLGSNSDAAGVFIPLSRQKMSQIINEFPPQKEFFGDLIAVGRGNPQRTLRHEGGHWAEDLLNERIIGAGRRPLDQTAEAYLQTGLTPEAANQIVSGAWNRNRQGLKDIYKHWWPGLDERGVASELFADIVDPNLSGLSYRLGKRFSPAARQKYVSSLEQASPGLDTMRNFAQSVYNPAWEKTTRGSRIVTPTASVEHLADEYDRLSKRYDW